MWELQRLQVIYLYIDDNNNNNNNNNNNKTTSFKEKDEIHSHGCVWACEESMGDVKLHSQLVVV